MGLFSKKKVKTSSTSDTTSNFNTSNTGVTNGTQTTTPNVPDFLLDPAKKLTSGIGNFIDQGAAAFTPGISKLQQGVFDAAGDLGDGARGLYDTAKGAIDAVGNIGNFSGADYIKKYYNPFKEQVLNPVLNDFDVQSGITRAAQAAKGAVGRAFGGSRWGIQEGQTEGELARGRAATEGGLLDRMYGQALGAGQTEASQAQAAAVANQQAQLAKASQYASLGDRQGVDERANLGLQGQLGGQQTALEAGIKQYPLEFQKQLEGLLQGLDPRMFTGSTGTQQGTSTNTGTGTTTGHTEGTGTQVSSGGFLGDLLLSFASAGGSAAKAAAGGGGG